MMIKFFNKVYGCQANVADSEGLSKFLLEIGCQQTRSELGADLIIINTCAIRDKAEQKLFSYIGKLADLKKHNSILKIGVIGCVASYRKQEIYKNFDHINFVHGAREEIGILQQYLKQLVEHIRKSKIAIERNQPTEAKTIRQVRSLTRFLLQKDSTFSNKESISNLNLTIHACGTKTDTCDELWPRSYINIMTGCNKYCSYCIVPFTRGREISYPMEQIITAVKKDIDSGIKEINLLGQNVNSYVDPVTGARFPDLLKRIAVLGGNFWVRFVSAHPQDMTKDLFYVLAQCRDKLTGFLHFPLQSGSDKILRAMNRNYTVDEFLQKISWAREILSDLTLTTDIIVGFPGEVEQDYLETRSVIEQVKFDQVYSFIYSRRKYTKAFSLLDSCSDKEKLKRLMDLQARQREISYECNNLWVGKTLKILVEKQLENGRLLARTEGNTRVLVDGCAGLLGKFAEAYIQNASVVNLFGRLSSRYLK